MNVLGHTIISLTVGTFLYNQSHSFMGFSWFLIAGILVDFDHYIDFVREFGVSFNLKRVYNTCRYGYANFKKMVLFLHSYEIMILLWVSVYVFSLGIVWRYIALSYTIHLILDQIFNNVKPFSYFFLYRMMNNFDVKKVFLVEKGGEYANRHR